MCKSCMDVNTGRIELIVGCMFAGKTEEFLRRIRRLVYAKKKALIFKPWIDDRYSKDKIMSHNKSQMKCVVIKTSKEIINYIKGNPEIGVLGIDEVQFFDSDLIDILNNLANKGYIIIANGLDLNFKAEPFKITKELFTISDFVTKLHAICIKCGNFANRTQRITNGKTASLNEKIILIGSQDNYEARCRKCYEIRK